MVPGDQQGVAGAAVAYLDGDRVVGPALTVEDEAVVAQAAGAHGLTKEGYAARSAARKSRRTQDPATRVCTYEVADPDEVRLRM